MKHAATIPVRLGDRSYEIYLREGLLDETHQLIRLLGIKPTRIALVTDASVEGFYAERALRSISRCEVTAVKIVMDPGEGSKSLQVLLDLYEAFHKADLDRGSLVVSLGGGVVGDVAGFAAATYLRGIPWIQIPTSMLAQVDSSVGGKTGINLPWGKNLAGAFHQPLAVLIDPELLHTLPLEELRNGLAEAIKAAVIADEKLFDYIETHREEIFAFDPKPLLKIVKRAVEIKAAIVEDDEREAGPRMLLNFGHTVGHAVETAKGYAGIRHGEAVAIGMSAEAILSADLGACRAADRDRLLRLLRQYKLPTQLPAEIAMEKLFEAMGQDKKRQDGVMKMVVLQKIGKARIEEKVNPSALRKILAILR